MPKGVRIEWTTDAVERMGKEPDGDIARTLGCSAAAVGDRRLLLGIPPYQSPGNRRTADPSKVKTGPNRARRSISVSRKCHTALVEKCAALGVSCSSIVETLSNDYIDRAERKEPRSDEEMRQARGY